MITPGPWKWFNDGDLANEDGKMVLRPDANRGVPTDDDAALIASAPDLKKRIGELELQVREARRHLKAILPIADAYIPINGLAIEREVVDAAKKFIEKRVGE